MCASKRASNLISTYEIISCPVNSELISWSRSNRLTMSDARPRLTSHAVKVTRVHDVCRVRDVGGEVGVAVDGDDDGETDKYLQLQALYGTSTEPISHLHRTNQLRIQNQSFTLVSHVQYIYMCMVSSTTTRDCRMDR